jgi:hypothetical protein
MDMIPANVDDPGLQLQLQPYLQSGEQVLWTGKPDPSRLIGRGDAFLIPFSLMWGGFAIVWEAGVLGFGAPFLFKLWGIPFVVVGQYFIWGRFVYKRWDRRRTVYGLTSQRVLILRGRSLQSVFLKQMPAINQTARIDGSGSLEFGDSPGGYGYSRWANNGMDVLLTGRAGPAFYDIPDVARVYGLIHEAQSSSG